MAQNEIQRYTTDQDFYNNIRNVLETWYNTHNKIEKMINHLNSADPPDYPTVPAETLSAIAGLRIACNTYLTASGTVDMMTEVQKFVRI